MTLRRVPDLPAEEPVEPAPLVSIPGDGPTLADLFPQTAEEIAEGEARRAVVLARLAAAEEASRLRLV